MRRTRLFLTLTFLMSCTLACDETPVSPSPPPLTPPSSATCNATAAQFAVGQLATTDLLDRARVTAGASTARFLRPNQLITLEYLGSRLNLHLNALMS